MDWQQDCGHAVQPEKRKCAMVAAENFQCHKACLHPNSEVRVKNLDLLSVHKKKHKSIRNIRRVNVGQFGLISMASIFPGLLGLLRSC